MQFHGITPREPYAFGADVTRVAKFYLDLRRQLQPYLIATARQSTATGTPMWRPLLWEWPDDPQAQKCDDQFLLGDDLLVAPMLHEFNERQIYLPPGDWTDAWTKTKHTGPTNLLYRASPEVIPVFTRHGRELPKMPDWKPAVEWLGENHRLWRGQKYEKIFARVHNAQPATLNAPAGFEVLPARTQSGERLAFYVMWPEECPVGTYPVNDINLVKLPAWPQPIREDGYVDLGKESETSATFQAQAGNARLFLGSGDGLTVWLNGEPVFDWQGHRTPERDEDEVPVKLRDGENHLRVRVSHPSGSIGPNGFYLRLAT
jgi:hypothetical protein